MAVAKFGIVRARSEGYAPRQPPKLAASMSPIAQSPLSSVDIDTFAWYKASIWRGLEPLILLALFLRDDNPFLGTILPKPLLREWAPGSSLSARCGRCSGFWS